MSDPIPPPRIAARGVYAGYGDVPVLHDLDIEVARGQVVALLGSNGAGKTTTLRVLSGLLRPSSGRVEVNGTDVTGRKPHQIARLGVGHVPEGRGTFNELTVAENIAVGGFYSRARRRDHVERAFALFPDLRRHAGTPAGNLSGGEQQMLALARALGADPDVLLLDEPSLGLAPLAAERFFDSLGGVIRSTGLAVLVVEQNVELCLEITDRIYVLENGVITGAGDASSVAAGDDLHRAFLGGRP